jgi:hypothetical protein
MHLFCLLDSALKESNMVDEENSTALDDSYDSET